MAVYSVCMYMYMLSYCNLRLTIPNQQQVCMYVAFLIMLECFLHVGATLGVS